MKRILCSFVLLFAVLEMRSSTIVSANIYTNTTWNLAGSPYIVTLDLVVFDGVTLTIDPGVVVEFDAGFMLDLRGKLVAIGNSTDSITFTSSSPNPSLGAWHGIRVTGTAMTMTSQLTMKYCKGMYADRMIDLDLAYEGPYIFEHSTFAYNNTVNYDGGDPYTLFSYCNIIGNNIGLQHAQFGGVARHCCFLNNVNAVQQFPCVDSCYFGGNTQAALEPYGRAIGNLVENNNIGVVGHFNSVNDTFMNNVVRNNTIGVQVWSFFNGYIWFLNNQICDNTAYNIQMFTTNNADLSQNCWCSTDSATIRNTIYDGYVNASYGLVTFLPLSSSCPMYTGVNEQTQNVQAIAVTPNPSDGKFILHVHDGEGTIFIYSLTGDVIQCVTVPNLNNYAIDIAEKPAGIYFLRVECGDRIYLEKLIRQ